MNTRRTFIAGASAFAALAATASAEGQHAASIYLHGMVWNQQLAAPQSDWLIRLDAKVDVPLGNRMTPTTGFATLGDDFHDTVGSHVAFDSAVLQGNQLVLSGRITESRDPALIGQTVRIEGKVAGTEVQDLRVTIGSSVFSGAGLLVVIAIIAILIA